MDKRSLSEKRCLHKADLPLRFEKSRLEIKKQVREEVSFTDGRVN